MDTLTLKLAKKYTDKLKKINALGSEADSLHRGMIKNNQIFAPRTAITMHFDDGRIADYSIAYPALLSRHLVAGFAVNEDTIDSGAAYCTTGNLLEMQQNGMEIMHHGKTHLATDVSISEDDFIEFSANSVNRLRAKGLNIQSLIMPGTVTGANNPIYFNTEEKLKNEYAQILRRTYRSFHGWLAEGGARNSMPYYYPWGYRSGNTIESRTLVQLQTIVEDAIRLGGTLCLTSHAFHFGEAGYLSVADFGTFLDYLVTKQNAGLIQVLTPTGAVFCRQGTLKSQVSDIELCTTATPLWWTLAGGATIETTGGHTGNNFAAIPYASGTGAIKSIITTKGYRTMLIKFWAKAPSTSGVVVFGAKTPYYVNGKITYHYNTWAGVSAINPVPVVGGSGYTVGDVLTVSGGSDGSVLVLAVDGNGAVTKLALLSSGVLYGTGTKATTGGTGTGCTVSITSLYTSTAQNNTLTVDTNWQQFTFAIGVRDASEIEISLQRQSSGDALIYYDDIEVYLI